MTLANSNMGFRPKISEILPQLGIEAELARRKAEPIQVYPAVELKCSLMVGKAVVMIVSALLPPASSPSRLLCPSQHRARCRLSRWILMCLVSLPFAPRALHLLYVAASRWCLLRLTRRAAQPSQQPAHLSYFNVRLLCKNGSSGIGVMPKESQQYLRKAVAPSSQETPMSSEYQADAILSSPGKEPIRGEVALLGPSSKTSRLGAVSWIVRFCRIKDHAEITFLGESLKLSDGAASDVLYADRADARSSQALPLRSRASW
ncbi:hypothetical protein KC320_g195 [Hortaea werneckii]|nr:hypothetical protein KC320_g195 [Hortaea werneckii]